MKNQRKSKPYSSKFFARRNRLQKIWSHFKDNQKTRVGTLLLLLGATMWSTGSYVTNDTLKAISIGDFNFHSIVEDKVSDNPGISGTLPETMGSMSEESPSAPNNDLQNSIGNGLTTTQQQATTSNGTPPPPPEPPKNNIDVIGSGTIKILDVSYHNHISVDLQTGERHIEVDMGQEVKVDVFTENQSNEVINSATLRVYSEKFDRLETMTSTYSIDPWESKTVTLALKVEGDEQKGITSDDLLQKGLGVLFFETTFQKDLANPDFLKGDIPVYITGTKNKKTSPPSLSPTATQNNEPKETKETLTNDSASNVTPDSSLNRTVSTATTSSTCSDTDRGKNFEEQGTLTATFKGKSEIMSLTDSCSGSTLKEYYCDGTTVYQDEKECDNGCQEGKCLPSSPSTNGSSIVECKDTDSKNDIYTKGIVTYGGADQYDMCSGDNKLIQVYCDGLASYTPEIDCKDGCKDGACLKDLKTESSNLECKDTDSKNDIYIQGKVTYGGNSNYDTCSDDQKGLIQFYCDGTTIIGKKDSTNCQNGCMDGACIAKAKPESTTTPPIKTITIDSTKKVAPKKSDKPHSYDYKNFKIASTFELGDPVTIEFNILNKGNTAKKKVKVVFLNKDKKWGNQTVVNIDANGSTKVKFSLPSKHPNTTINKKLQAYILGKSHQFYLAVDNNIIAQTQDSYKFTKKQATTSNTKSSSSATKKESSSLSIKTTPKTTTNTSESKKEPISTSLDKNPKIKIIKKETATKEEIEVKKATPTSSLSKEPLSVTQVKETLKNIVDIKSDAWYATYVAKLVKYGAVSSQESFRPGAEITRAEASKMISILTLSSSDIQTKGQKSSRVFCDVREKDWFFSYIMALYNENVIGGYPLNGANLKNQECVNYYPREFKPTAKINRAEAAKFLLSAFNIVAPSVTSQDTQVFSDVNPNDWFSRYVVYLSKKGIVKGFDNGTFGPAKSITRAEFAKILIGLKEA